ncbi:MAG: HD family hydrolase [Rhodobiaceae bacterium]|nr:HD family hydrolase [Rhodobiaceae bacterium]
MLSGRRLDLIDPSPLDVELSDIAHGLARVARWNGQTIGDHAFSVAQHSLLVAEIVRLIDPAASAGLQLAALLHDAPEYVIGDMISPFKAVIGGDYKQVETRLLDAIHLHFGLPVPLPTNDTKLIKRADRIAAFLEATQLAGFSDEEAAGFFGRPGRLKGGSVATLEPLKPQPAATVESAFSEQVLAAMEAAASCNRKKLR